MTHRYLCVPLKGANSLLSSDIVSRLAYEAISFLAVTVCRLIKNMLVMIGDLLQDFQIRLWVLLALAIVISVSIGCITRYLSSKQILFASILTPLFSYCIKNL